MKKVGIFIVVLAGGLVFIVVLTGGLVLRKYLFYTCGVGKQGDFGWWLRNNWIV